MKVMMIKRKPKKTKQEINEESRELKRKRKHKGLPSGSRFNVDSKKKKSTRTQDSTDPRIGSKKAIPLIVDENVAVNKPKPQTLVKKEKLSPEKELQKLEDDEYLNELLDLVEAGTTLSTKQQHELDAMLDRIDQLMQQLGYNDDDALDDELDEPREDIVSLLKQK